MGLTVALPVHGRAHTRSRALACHRNAKSSPLCLSLYVSLRLSPTGSWRRWAERTRRRGAAAVARPSARAEGSGGDAARASSVGSAASGARSFPTLSRVLLLRASEARSCG